MKDGSHRLKRLLYLVPYVAKNPDGVDTTDLAQTLGIDRTELLQDLELLAQVGPPEGDPGEYLLVSVEEGRVFIDLPHRLTRPLRLTPVEGYSLLLGLRALKASGIAPFDDALASAERKLLVALGQEAQKAEDLATGTVVAEPESKITSHLRQVVTAARKLQIITIEYAAASRANAEKREVHPYGVVHHSGAWYLVGHCVKRNDVRTFRLDRMESIALTDQNFAPPEHFNLDTYRREHLYVPSADSVTVRISLDGVATSRIGAAWPVGDVTHFPGGTSEIAIDCEGFEWVTGWVLGLGGHARITGPKEAQEALLKRLSAVAATVH